MKLQRLKGRKNNEKVLRDGRVWKGKTMVIRSLAGPPRNHPALKGLIVGVLASSKLHKSAVKRNRMRRRCREALRKTVATRENLPTVQLLLCPRSSSLSCAHIDIQSDVDAFLSTL